MPHFSCCCFGQQMNAFFHTTDPHNISNIFEVITCHMGFFGIYRYRYMSTTLTSLIVFIWCYYDQIEGNMEATWRKKNKTLLNIKHIFAKVMCIVFLHSISFLRFISMHKWDECEHPSAGWHTVWKDHKHQLGGCLQVPLNHTSPDGLWQWGQQSPSLLDHFVNNLKVSLLYIDNIHFLWQGDETFS